MVLPPALLKCVRIGEKLIALMRLTLYSSFATHSEAVAIAVAVVDCPNLNRPPAFLPPLHHSSITLAALILFAPFPSSPVLAIPPHLTTIYTLCSKKSSIVLKSFLTSLEKRTVETNNFSFLP